MLCGYPFGARNYRGKKRMANIWCDRRLILSPIYFGLCTTEKAFHKELRRMNVPIDTWPSFITNEWSNATCHQFQKGDDGKLCCIVCIYPKKETAGIEIAALLVHEAVHIWQAVRENIGEEKPSSEFEAYSIQCISLGLMDQYYAQTQGK